MFHTTLDAVGNTFRVHYKSTKYDVIFSQDSVSALFRSGEHVFVYVQNCSSCLQQCKKIILENQTSFSRVMMTNVLPRFFANHGVELLKPYSMTLTILKSYCMAQVNVVKTERAYVQVTISNTETTRNTVKNTLLSVTTHNKTVANSEQKCYIRERTSKLQQFATLS